MKLIIVLEEWKGQDGSLTPLVMSEFTEVFGINIRRITGYVPRMEEAGQASRFAHFEEDVKQLAESFYENVNNMAKEKKEEVEIMLPVIKDINQIAYKPSRWEKFKGWMEDIVFIEVFPTILALVAFIVSVIALSLRIYR